MALKTLMFSALLALIALPNLARAGQVFQDCPDCPEMVVISAGSFVMGSPDSEEGRFQDEGPQHQVTIDRPFAVGKYDVTFAEWDACIADGGCSGYKPDDHGWGRGKRPVINVSWQDAQRYIIWISEKTGKRYRLPSESEWEYASRAGTSTARYWGDDVGDNQANCNVCGSLWDGMQTAPVGSFPANAFGLYDMIGNVWQWTKDCYRNSYQGSPTDGSASTAGDCGYRVVRGGGWSFDARFARAAYRDWNTPGDRGLNLSFRVARML